MNWIYVVPKVFYTPITQHTTHNSFTLVVESYMRSPGQSALGSIAANQRTRLSTNQRLLTFVQGSAVRCLAQRHNDKLVSVI